MGFGVLEGIPPQCQYLTRDRVLEHVPGTVLLNEKGADLSTIGTSGLKHGVGADSHIVLAPQPSEDPNDPLNWSKFRKELNFLVLSLGCILYSAVSVQNP